MGSSFDFKNFGNASNSSMKPPGNSPLPRQNSIYALTFDEFQNTWGGSLGKDFGSVNMDELLKSIGTAEETQAMVNSVGVGEGSAPANNLQRQGSLTLPRTLSQKTVDQVWRDLVKENNAGNGNVGAHVAKSQRQPTLGEITLEEFLARAGVVREDAQQMGMMSNSGYIGDLSRLNNTNGVGFSFQNANQNDGLLGAQVIDSDRKLAANQPSSLVMTTGDVKSSQQVPRQQIQQQHPLIPKPANLAFASPMQLANSAQLSSPRPSGPAAGITDPSLNSNITHAGGLSLTGLGTGGVTVSTQSPRNQILPSVMSSKNADSPSLSPVPYTFSRGRKSGAALEKVIERRQRRMIKNRESAARSRARKQAYTMELEAEIAKLKEVNEELQRKQADIIEMQKNQVLETMNKRACLRRTLTANW